MIVADSQTEVNKARPVTGHTHICPDGRVGYRTKLTTESTARNFARCLAANPLYQDAEAVRSRTAKDPDNWYVRYIPRPNRCEAIAARLGDEREARALAEGDGYTFWPDPDVPSLEFVLSASGEVYELAIVRGRSVDCNCPDQRYRGRKTGIACKHIRARNRRADQAEPLSFEQVYDRLTPANRADVKRFQRGLPYKHIHALLAVEDYARELLDSQEAAR